ncbi:MAG: hypothetical protein ACRC7S_04805 [Cetobacterium sp.]
MKKIGYSFIVLLFLLSEIALFFRFKNNILSYRSIFWICHFILCFLFFIFNNRLNKEKEFDIFILVFPVVGFLMLFINQFLFFRDLFKSDIEVNEDLEKYISEEQSEIIVNKSIDLNLIGAYDVLAVGTPHEKKDFLIGFEAKSLKFKIEVLKKALWDNDIEVIHYAATEINKIDESFQKSIIEKTELKDLNELCKIYFEYCESGLLKDEVLEFYQRKYLELLSQKENLSLEDRYMELIISKEMKNDYRCNEIIKILFQEKIEDEKIIEFIKKYYYDKNDKKMLKEVEEWQESV